MEVSSYFIRSLTRLDDAFLWGMLYHVIYVPEGTDPLPRSIVSNPEIARYVENWWRIGDFGFAAVRTLDSSAVGAVWGRLFAAGCQGYGYVDDETPELAIAVLPAYRGRGIGTALLMNLIRDAEPRYPALSLSVSSNNPAAIVRAARIRSG